MCTAPEAGDYRALTNSRLGIIKEDEMTITIEPSTANGRIQAPPSKSMAHRLLLCAGLASGTSLISNAGDSDDILATLDCLRALGAQVTREGNSTSIRGINPCQVSPQSALSCRESASTLRFIIPICLLSGQPIQLTGSGKLFTRPLSIYEEICRSQGLLFEKCQNSLTIAGKLAPGRYVVPGGISSQFISGLLFALPLLDGDSTLELIPPVESRPYIRMTIDALKKFGVTVLTDCPDSASPEDFREIFIAGGQHYCPRNLQVEGDYSAAAFFEALGSLGGNVQVDGLDENSLQGDRVYRHHFEVLRNRFAEIDLSDCPDLGPILIAMAAALNGGRFTGTRRLRLKESDRGAAMQQELRKMGVRIDVLANEILVLPGLSSRQVTLEGHNDHRIVMALSILLTKTGGSIRGAEAVSKSMPDFFDRLRSLGVKVS